MIKESDILNTLDNIGEQKDNPNYFFVSLGEPYSYLIDSRINLFRSDNDNWAIVIERLGYNPRASAISLEIFNYGNCLINLETCSNGMQSNVNYAYPIEKEIFLETTDFDTLLPEAQYWIVRGQKVYLSRNNEDYIKAGIVLRFDEPNEFRLEEVGRLLVFQNQDLFRATDEELYQSIPKELQKILVIDEWYHKDFYLMNYPDFSANDLSEIYKFNSEISDIQNKINLDDFISSSNEQLKFSNEIDQETWNNDRPSTYETWQQIAKVIALNDVKYYAPTLNPNSHWKNWLQSGEL